jgi:rubrerythrin
MKRTVLAAALLLAIAYAATAAAGETAKTAVEGLQAAYIGERNASAKYAVYAAKADEEGYGAVASLFRAASLAEKIHAENHAAVLKKLGAIVPMVEIQKPAPKSTKENLADAIKGESYERDVMYPQFLKLAQAEKKDDVARTLDYAKAAEAEHAKLYAEALNNLDKWKGAAREFFVCRTCGFTVTKIDFDVCPGCGKGKDQYSAVK